MKLRTIVKIALTSSIVLLCTGFALYSFFKLSATEHQKDFDLFSLVPLSASAVFATDDAVQLMAEVDELTCSKNQQFTHVSRLFTYLKDNLNKILEDAPHGLSRQMSQVLISFHEPDNDRNQVLYCCLGSNDQALVEQFIQKYVSSSYPAKEFKYKGEKICIYPMSDGDFLSCYLTPNYMALSYQKKLIEEVIDTDKSGQSLAVDSTFKQVYKPRKNNMMATVYARSEGVIGWTEYDMTLKDELIYFSGVSHDVDTCFTTLNTLRRQESVLGFPGDILPSTTFYFTKQGVTNWSSILSLGKKLEYTKAAALYDEGVENERLSHYLIENVGKDIVTCLFQRKDSLLGAATVMSLSVSNVAEAERMLRSYIDSTPMESGFKKKKAVSFRYVLDKAYPIYLLPYPASFSQLTDFADSVSYAYATFYGGRLLLAPDADSVLSYIHQLDGGNVLNSDLAYQAGMDGLLDTFHLLLMVDFEQVFCQPEEYAHLIPQFFVRNSSFFRNFILFAQFSSADGVMYPNIVLKYKND